jgi:UDP-N-acetylglucosamine/UDP-N-acetyl-alpha-D-glucosaminouronate 4-epimerase
MRAFVTGGAGFIGSSIARALIAQGNEVVVFDSFATGFRDFVPPEAALVEGDLSDLEVVRAAVKGADVVFHQGALRSVAKSVEDPLASNSANVTGTLHILVAAHEAGVQRVVYASSSSVYGDPAEPLRREDQPLRPISPYGVSKLAGEMYCSAWTAVQGLPTVSLRYFNVFGPGQHRESKYAAVFPAFVGALLQGRAPEIDWDGEQSRDFTYIDDVVEANLRAAGADSSADGAAFNIGAGRGVSVNQVLRSVSDAVGVWIDPVSTPKRPGDVRHTLADISRARATLGWEPRAQWEDAIRATVDWFRSHSG